MIPFLTSVVVILIIVIVLCLIIIRNCLIKLEILEKWIISYRSMIYDTLKKIREIDEKQMFEKDDDVGFVFESLTSLISDLNNKIHDENAQ
jgi:predicted Holliday junction resolvase-like endonuclease